MTRARNHVPTATTRPLLVEALDRWRRADEAFAHAGSRGERGAAMIEQLRARHAVHRLSEIELSVSNRLRALLVQEGVWSPRDALDRLDAVPFDNRAASLRELTPMLPDDGLRRAHELATRAGWADDDRWEVDDDLVRDLSARVRGGELPQDGVDRCDGPEALPVPESTDHTLEQILVSCRVDEQNTWLESSLQAAIDYVERDLLPEHVTELIRKRGTPLFAEFRSALLASGRELWMKHWFRRVFDAEERREHLCRVIADRESKTMPWSYRFYGLLDVAQRLEGAARATVLRWAAAEREKGGRSEMAADLARVAALAEGQDRSAIVAKIEPQIEEVGTEDRLTTIVTLMPGAGPADAIRLARRGLQAIATGEAKVQDATALLSSIGPTVWANLLRADWESALQAGSSRPNGWAAHLRWTPFDLGLLAVPNLPEEVRRTIEEHGLPALLEQDADDRLRIGAESIHALSPAGRAQLVASVLALDAAAWRATGSAVAPIARYLNDDELERLGRTLQDPDPKGGCDAINRRWSAADSVRGEPRGTHRRWGWTRARASSAWAWRGVCQASS